MASCLRPGAVEPVAAFGAPVGAESEIP